MNDDAFDNAELTLFYTETKYRRPDGSEHKAFQVKPYGRVRFNLTDGTENDWITPVTVGYEGQATEATYNGNAPGQLRIRLEPAPIEDDKNWLHSFGNF